MVNHKERCSISLVNKKIDVKLNNFNSLDWQKLKSLVSFNVSILGSRYSHRLWVHCLQLFQMTIWQYQSDY